MTTPKMKLSVADGEMIVGLKAWVGFRDRPTQKASDGRIMISVGGDSMIFDDEELEPHHRAAFDDVLANQVERQQMLLSALSNHFAKQLDGKELTNSIVLTGIHIHHAALGGIAYVGYHFGCAWDAEHGVGVMTHRDRIVEIGDGDTAILGEVAEADAKLRKKEESKARRTGSSTKPGAVRKKQRSS